MSNWKAPGPDLVQGYWRKNFTNMHDRIIEQLNECLDKGQVPQWMTKGRTVLIMKDTSQGNVAWNYRPNIIIIIIIIIIITIIIIIIVIRFSLVVGCASASPRCLETQRFPQQVSSSKDGR